MGKSDQAWVYSEIRGGSRQEFNPGTVVWTRQPAAHLLHSTEGSSWPSYGGNGKSAPHFTVDPRKEQTRQHLPLTEGAWALQAHGHPTNQQGYVQYEIIGTCDPRNGSLPSVVDLPQSAVEYLAHVLTVVGSHCDIPARSTVTWRPYPESYGTGASQRLSHSTWDSYTGILGHQHAPDNDHGDPGAFPISRLLEAMGSAPAPKPEPGDGDLEEDGFWGTATTKALQRSEGTVVDGEAWHQSNHWRAANPGLTSGWGWENPPVTGSPVIAALQRRLGIHDDGLIGPDTIRALQGHYGLVKDGELWSPSPAIEALQRSLNTHGHA